MRVLQNKREGGAGEEEEDESGRVIREMGGREEGEGGWGRRRKGTHTAVLLAFCNLIQSKNWIYKLANNFAQTKNLNIRSCTVQV